MPLDDNGGRRATRNTFAGQGEGEQLVEWLNDEEPRRIGTTRKELRNEARTRKRIAQLINDLNESAEAFFRKGKPDLALNERIDVELAHHSLKVKVLYPEKTGKHKTFAAPKWT